MNAQKRNKAVCNLQLHILKCFFIILRESDQTFFIEIFMYEKHFAVKNEAFRDLGLNECEMILNNKQQEQKIFWRIKLLEFDKAMLSVLKCFAHFMALCRIVQMGMYTSHYLLTVLTLHHSHLQILKSQSPAYYLPTVQVAHICMCASRAAQLAPNTKNGVSFLPSHNRHENHPFINRCQ